MTSSPDRERVVVVGAGIIGIACAHYLSAAGYQVTVIDKGTVANACSHGNCGYICPSHVLPLARPGVVRKALASIFDPQAAFRMKPRFSPAFWNWLWQFYKRCNKAHMSYAGTHLKSILDFSMAEYKVLAPTLPASVHWRESGLLYVFQTASGIRDFAEEDKFLSDEFTRGAQRIEGSELPTFDPALKSGLAGAYLYKDDAYLDPAQLCSAWAAKLRTEGVEFVENCALQSIQKSQGDIRQIGTDQGDFQAEHFVIAAGSWSTKLAGMLACRIPIEPGKGYSVTMDRPKHCPQYPMLFPEHHIGVTPLENSYRLGSMMEFVGYDDSIPRQRIQQLKDSAEPYLIEPYTDGPTEEWYGWRPMTWDSLPIIGRVPGSGNAYLATGHNMLGMSLAAGTGRLIAEIVQQKETPIDSSAFSPARF